ncbi:MAG: hypothetical protein KIH08_12380 [Candidatus Freyarchaeota archaeon]|nr:hypothetical protein [Candidatus Jordarchaeia archaeon]MBS7270078.1 hypothetical protein [Candidatus Jordarchaeia archaeon]MBS7280740.1 hypothetical protein [Candidatus Jordarchaeia archaeon]
MNLCREDVELFYKLYHPLLIYVNKKFNIASGVESPEDFRDLEKIVAFRDKLFEHPELIDSFVRENPYKFSKDELNIILSWKNFVKGEFIVYRYLEKYTIFLDIAEQPKAYGVLGLKSPLEEVLGPHLPIMTQAVLLPFKGKIIYDSLLVPYNIIFGGGIRRSFNEAYQEAKHRFGIITSLPFSAKEEKSDIEKLKFYLKSESNRERYWEEIEELINKNQSLLKIYHQEMGKIQARTIGKRLREIGVTQGWFAILEDEIIASGTTREETERNAQNIVPPEKKDFVYIFQLKEKK